MKNNTGRLGRVVTFATLHFALFTFVLTLAAGLAHAADASPAPKEVIVVFKTHFDIGYTDLAKNVVARYRTEMIDKALAVADQSKDLPPENRFVWTLSGWPMSQILGPEQTPERRNRILKAIRDGRLVWHALPATLHTESLDLEDIVRGMGFSSQLSRSLDMELPRDAKMTDVPCHTWILPTILVRAGVEFLHIGCNAASTSPEVPPLFWWEGPDGSRLLTMYTAGDYGTGLVPPKDWPFATWLALIHTGDNHGPPDAGEVKALLDRAAREMPGVKVRMGRLSDFSDAIRREKAEIPVVRADMPDSWVHGIMSMPQETKIARDARPAIAAGESLATLLRSWGIAVPDDKNPNYEERPQRAGRKSGTAEAYEQSLLYGEHTWGIDFKRFGKRVYGKEWEAENAAGRYKLAEDSWIEHANYARAAEKSAMPALATDLDGLVRAVKVKGPRIVVYNPLPWTRDDVVEVDLPGLTSAGLTDAATGNDVPVGAPVGPGEKAYRFIARGVPPMGYRTYVANKGAGGGTEDNLSCETMEGRIENAFFRLKFEHGSPKVGPASIIDKRTGRELVDATGEFGLGQYVYERFDAAQVASYIKSYCKMQADWVTRDYGKADLPSVKEKPLGPTVNPPKNSADGHKESFSEQMNKILSISEAEAQRTGMTITPHNNVLVRWTEYFPGSEDRPHATKLTWTLYANEPWIDIEWKIHDKPADPWPEAGWLALPLKVDAPKFLLGRTGSLVDPAKDIARGASHVTFCTNTGLAVTGPDGAGVGIALPDSPIVSLERRGIYQFSKDFVAKKPLVWVNLYNNAFGVNFQQWIGGSWGVRVRLWSIAAGENAGESLTARGWEARQPCRAATFDGPAGTLPPTRAGIELSRKGVLVTAFGPNPDGVGTILRLWEQVGQDGPCRVKLPEGMRPKKVQPVDLRGRPAGEAIAVDGGEFAVPMTHFAPASLLLE